MVQFENNLFCSLLNFNQINSNLFSNNLKNLSQSFQIDLKNVSFSNYFGKLSNHIRNTPKTSANMKKLQNLEEESRQSIAVERRL